MHELLFHRQTALEDDCGCWGTPTLFIDRVVHRRGQDPALLETLAG